MNLLPVAQDEKVAALVAVEEFDAEHFLFFATKKGKVKKTELAAYANPRSTGIIAVALEEGDDLLDARLTDGASHVFLGTHKGMGIRFPESDVRPMGRVAAGVRGISLRADDFVEVMAAFPADEKGEILVVAERGFGKRTPVADFREQGRGGKGITLMRVTARTGSVAGMRHVSGDEDIMLVTARGMMIRTSASGVRRIGRATQGVKLIDLEGDDQVVAVAKLAEREEDGSDSEVLFEEPGEPT